VTTPADPRLGTRLAGYQIQALLGRGGMGVVYLAEQTGPHRQVALKLLLTQAATSEAFRERFLRESELAAAIDHPNVLPVYDAGETDGVLWIAMRYVDGIDLAARLAREGPLTPEQALAIGGQVAGALDAAHSRGLVHRDVKPGNVLLAVEGGAVTHAYLADFGLTRRVSGGVRGLTVSGQVLGTIDYVAPEQVEGGQVDGRADQYSLGCVLFECLTGMVPFRRDSELAVLWAHVNDPPPRLGEHRPDLPAALDETIGRALAKAPGDRYPSCAALVATAQAALAGTSPVGVRRRVGRPAGHRAGRGRRRPGGWPVLRWWCWPPRLWCCWRWSWRWPSCWPGTEARLRARPHRRCWRRPTTRSGSTRRPTSRSPPSRSGPTRRRWSAVAGSSGSPTDKTAP
jgi:serine/threonine protein kinase